MKLSLLLIILIVLSSLAFARNSEATDLAKLQGEWRIVAAFDREGRRIAVEDDKELKEFASSKIIFVDNKLIFLHPEGIDISSFKLDPSRSPKWIDHTALTSGDSGRTFPGIYELAGDCLRLSLAKPDEARPTHFKMMGEIALELEREATLKTSALDSSVRKREAEKLCGTWILSAIVNQDGQRFTLDKPWRPSENDRWIVAALPFHLAIFLGDRLIIQDGRKGGQCATQLDPTQALKQIDFLGIESGLDSHSLYELNGNKLRLCFARPGGNRPTQFKTVKEEAIVLELEREKH